MVTKLFIYIISIILGGILLYFTINIYLDEENMRSEAVLQTVILKDKQYINKMWIKKIEYSGKIYNYYGGTRNKNIGDTLSLSYNKNKDKFISFSSKKHYIPHIFLSICFIFGPIYGLIIMLRENI